LTSQLGSDGQVSLSGCACAAAGPQVVLPGERWHRRNQHDQRRADAITAAGRRSDRYQYGHRTPAPEARSTMGHVDRNELPNATPQSSAKPREVSAVASALLSRNPKTKRPRRVLEHPPRPYSTEENAFDAAG